MTLGDIPLLGVGIGYRNELRAFFRDHADEIDWYELVADRYFSSLPESSDWLADFRERNRLVPHGLDLSIGTDGPLDPKYGRHVAELVRLVRAPYYTDHLCMTQAGGVQLGHLTPLPFTKRTALAVAEKAKAVQDALGVPMLLENIAYSFVLPGDMGEADFVGTVADAAGCGLLLDVTNLFVNSRNHGYDPYEYLGRIPLERVIQIHLAGSEMHEGTWVDSHSQSVDVHPEVWSILDYVVRRADVRAILLERDQNFPDDVGELVRDLRHARAILSAARAAPERIAPLERAERGGDARGAIEVGRSSDTGAAPAAASSSEGPRFQALLAQVLVDPGLRARLDGDGAAVVREAGLDESALDALRAAGLDALGQFASSLENKRFGMVSKSSPALYKLLELSSTLHEVRAEFVRRCPPVERSEFASRTIRDAYWVQRLVRQMAAEGRLKDLASDTAGDVARFEEILLDLGTDHARVDSARFFEGEREAWAALSDDSILTSFPRVGPHAKIERFGCHVTSVVKALMGGALPDPSLRRATCVLFVKHSGLRNVQYFEVNAMTERLLTLCDGERTTSEIADELRRDVAPSASRAKTAGMIRQLAQKNVVAIDGSLRT